MRNYLLFTSKVNLSFSNPHTRPSAFRKPPQSFHSLKVTHLQWRHPALSLGLAKSLTACFASKVLLEPSHVPLLVNGLRLLLSCCNRDCMTQKNLKYINLALHKKVCSVLLELCEKQNKRVLWMSSSWKMYRKKTEKTRWKLPRKLSQHGRELPYQQVKCLPGGLLREPGPSIFAQTACTHHLQLQSPRRKAGVQ